jgi:tetratricopeptide (TPR) repeat protein
MTKGYYDKSLEHFKKCLEIKTQIEGAISMDVAWVLTSMGNVYRAKQDYGKALEYYNQCLDIKTQIKGPKSDDVTWAIDSIGDFYR